jgi:hypothetical protein
MNLNKNLGQKHFFMALIEFIHLMCFSCRFICSASYTQIRGKVGLGGLIFVKIFQKSAKSYKHFDKAILFLAKVPGLVLNPINLNASGGDNRLI